MREKVVYLIRHCEATGQGPESPLTTKGQEQAFELAQFFEDKSIDKIVSSPFKRAIQSIEPLANNRSINIEIDDNLSERILSSNHMDNWQECLERTFQDLDLSFPGGESSNDAMKRANLALDNALKHSETSIAIVTHGNLMSLLSKTFDEQIGFSDWKALTNPDVYRITLGDQPIIERIWGFNYENI